MGELLVQSHRSYSTLGLGCRETDILVALVRDEMRGITPKSLPHGSGKVGDLTPGSEPTAACHTSVG